MWFDPKRNKCRPKQRRYYGKDGMVELDIDYTHGNGDNSHTFPHEHPWPGGHRLKDGQPCNRYAY